MKNAIGKEEKSARRKEKTSRNMKEFGVKSKEFFRKKLVHLKRHPVTIPKILLVLACIVFTFQLSQHSNSVMYVRTKIIALTVFIVTLASIMSIISFIGVKTFGKKSIVQTIITCVLLLLQIGLDIYYLYIMHYETAIRDNPVPMRDFMQTSVSWTYVHLAMLGLVLLSIALLPVYSKLLMKIDTRPEAEKNADGISEYGMAPLEAIEEETPEERSVGV